MRVQAGLSEIATGATEHQETRRVLRIARWALLVIAAVLTVIFAAGWILRAQTPGWIAHLNRPADASSPQRAEAVERGAWAEFSRVRVMTPQGGLLQSEPWQVSLAASDAEAWLTHRLAATTELAATWNLISAKRVAEGVRSWRVAAFEPGATTLGGGVLIGMESASGRWTWLRAEVRGHQAHAAKAATPLVRLADVGQGNTKFPVAALSLVGVSPDLTRAANVLSDDSFWRVKLPDGREVRLLAIAPQSDAQGGRITLTCQTVLDQTGR